ncbi:MULTISPECIES: hypothetical protein [unclassified Pantoea]|uniref:hypothetical protein n=1 Tax=unclassified Pantoea TaxID=2630326 RepID=UPI001231A2CE|nr:MULTISPECIES: hypothetical protein [unclassified Pantoea]KAA6103352.1 hypothetical protein F3I21_01110 [Pantoea sp. B_9]KAA6111753.1 hypothetical protein F3I18_15135 [Pantoea sp. B_10]
MPGIYEKTIITTKSPPPANLNNLTEQEEEKIAQMALKLKSKSKDKQNLKPKYKQGVSTLTPEQLVKIRRACVLGHSARAISDAFKVPVSFVLEEKKIFDPKKYQKEPLCLVHKGLMSQQMAKEGYGISEISQEMGLHSRMIEKLLRIKLPEYLEQQMLTWDVVLRNLRSSRYVENPIWKDDTVKSKIPGLIAQGRSAIAIHIGNSKRKWRNMNITRKKEKIFETTIN